jgi:hypothetical protein
VEAASRTDARVRSALHLRADERVFRERLELAEVSREGLVAERVEDRELSREVAVERASAPLELVVASEAEVVGEAFEAGDVERPSEHALEQRKVVRHDLILEGAGPGGDDDARAREHARHEVRERLARAGARLDDGDALAREQVLDHLRHRELARPMRIARQLREEAKGAEHVVRTHAPSMTAPRAEVDRYGPLSTPPSIQVQIRTMTILRIASCLVLVLAVGCGSCGGKRAGDAGPVAQPLPPAPQGLTAEFGVDDLGALLTALRAQTSPEVARMALPDGSVTVVENFAPLPEPLRAHIPANARMRSVVVKIGDDVKGALAVRITRNADAAHPLGQEIALVPGAPHDAKWIVAAPADGAPALALLDDVLLVGDDKAVLELVTPYLVRVAMRADVGPGAHMRMAPGALGGPLRAMLDNLITLQAESGIAAARSERSRHADAPTLGEPEQAVTMARDNARRLLAYLPDAGEVRGALRVLPHGVDLDIRVAVTAGTPLAREIAAVDVGAPFGMAGLPRSIAVARSSTHDGQERALDSVVRFAGNRLSDEERTKLEAAETALEAATGPAHVVGIGGGREGAYVLYGATPRNATLDTEKLRAALGVPFVGGMVGSVIGCENLAPAPIREGTPASLCRTTAAPFPQIELTRAEGVVALALTMANTAGTPHEAPRTFVQSALRGGAGTLGESPDVARALTALGDHVISAIVIVPTNIVPSLGLFDVGVLRRIAAAPPGDETIAPTFLAATREADGVHFRIIITPHGADQLFQVGFLVAQLAMTP